MTMEMGMEINIIFGSVCLCVLVMAGLMNPRRRIRKYIESLDGHTEEIEWKPVSDWLCSKSQIHRVLYLDSQGVHHERYCKTGRFTDVCFVEDN